MPTDDPFSVAVRIAVIVGGYGVLGASIAPSRRRDHGGGDGAWLHRIGIRCQTALVEAYDTLLELGSGPIGRT